LSPSRRVGNVALHRRALGSKRDVPGGVAQEGGAERCSRIRIERRDQSRFGVAGSRRFCHHHDCTSVGLARLIYQIPPIRLHLSDLPSTRDSAVNHGSLLMPLWSRAIQDKNHKRYRRTQRAGAGPFGSPPCPFIKDRLEHAVAVVDCTRKVKRTDDNQIVEGHVLTRPLVYLECDQPGAVAIGRVGHRLAGATMIAATVLNVLAFDLPAFAHSCLPCFVFGVLAFPRGPLDGSGTLNRRGDSEAPGGSPHVLQEADLAGGGRCKCLWRAGGPTRMGSRWTARCLSGSGNPSHERASHEAVGCPPEWANVHPGLSHSRTLGAATRRRGGTTSRTRCAHCRPAG